MNERLWRERSVAWSKLNTETDINRYRSTLFTQSKHVKHTLGRYMQDTLSRKRHKASVYRHGMMYNTPGHHREIKSAERRTITTWIFSVDFINPSENGYQAVRPPRSPIFSYYLPPLSLALSSLLMCTSITFTSHRTAVDYTQRFRSGKFGIGFA